MKDFRHDESIAVNAIISQEPAAKTMLEPCEGYVDIVISLGAAPVPTEVPPPTETPGPTDTPAPPTETPTVTPVPPTPDPRLFFDDFEAGIRPEWDRITGSWIMVNGKYSLTDIGNDWTRGLSLVGDYNWTDYKVSTKVNMKGTGSAQFNGHCENVAYIIIRAQDAQNFLAFKMIDWCREYATWFIVKNNEWAEVSNIQITDYPRNGSFTVDIIAKHDLITTYINGLQVSQWSTARYLNGRVGLRIKSRERSKPLSFDDFLVEKLEP